MFWRFLFSIYLEDDEKVYFVGHRHPFIVLVPFLKYVFFGIILPMVLFLFFPSFWFVALIWLFFGFLRLVYEWLDWYYDAWLLTNLSVIDVEWRGFFNRYSTRIEYHMIEGVSYEFVGFIQTIFGYGKMSIQKIGSGSAIVLEDAINPKKVERNILKYQNKFVSDKNFREHTALKELLVDMLVEQSKKSR